MPTVAALVWKNMLLDPNYGIFAWITTRFGIAPIPWLENYPLFSVIVIVSWEWLPFATLILLTALQSLDEERKEAAEMDGANAHQPVLLHRAAAPGARHHRGHPDRDDLPARRSSPKSSSPPAAAPATPPPTSPISSITQALLDYDVGGASAGGVIAVILANIVAIFLVRIVGKNLDA